MMAHKSLIILTTLTFVMISSFALGNNLELKNLNVSSVNTAANLMTFTYDLNQDNSWRNNTNFDAIWTFMKYSIDGGITWKHASMAGVGANPPGFFTPSNFELIVPNDQKGFFIQRNDFGSSAISATGIKFVWNYGQDGVSSDIAQSANTLHKIFGIEMVYIPQGAFFAGDNNSSSEYRFIEGTSDLEPWYIQNENAITTTNTSSNGFYYQTSNASGENSSGDVFLIPASFPKGYQAFYLMKYELTEGEWVGFFNTLTTQAKNNRDITSSTNGGKNSDGVINRNTVAWDSSKLNSKAFTLRSNRPMSYLSWPDIAAFSAWAGLRPITELEYEKAARGKDIPAVADEFVWGTTSSSAPNSVDIYPNNEESGVEIINSPANINRNNLFWVSGDGRVGGIAENQRGPLRVGIFSANASNRISSGAGYYGNMELSGNLSEQVVTIGRSQGRQFLASHGSGELTTKLGYEGFASNTDWPGINTADSSFGVTGTKGIGYRGGDFATDNVRAYQLSSRSYAAKDPDSQGHYQRFDPSFGIFGGGRLGRTAP